MTEGERDIGALLALLQHGDSFFPSGAVAFSSGLETLAAEGLVRGADEVAAFAVEQLESRWASADRGILFAAWTAAGDLAQVAAADRLQEAMTLPRELREGSSRAGRALLSVHTRLATPGARDYAGRIGEGSTPGHLAAVQGLVWRAAGLAWHPACAAAAHAQAVGLLGAALRLGLIGHVAAQALLGELRPRLAALVATPPPALDRLWSYAPVADVAAMRHERQRGRLFSS